MARPAAPTEQGGDKILFLTDDNGGTPRANAMKGYHHELIDSSDIAELGVYPTSGILTNWGYTLILSATSEHVHNASLPCRGMRVRASDSNTGVIYVGTSSVTDDEGASTSGYPLHVVGGVGEYVDVPCRNASEVFIIGTSGDKVACLIDANE